MLRMCKPVLSFFISAATAAALALPLPTSSLAQTDDASYSSATYSNIWERFSGFDAESEVQVNHMPLDDFLYETVLLVGRSKSKQGTEGKQARYNGSKIRSSTSGAPSKYESNRVMFHVLTEQHKDFLWGYKAGLEALSNRRPLRELSKNEQLAFWLNLYNVTVLGRLADEYPIQKLKSLRQSKKQTPFWGQKTVTVEGVPLSLVDIEQILFHNWDDPRVMYGLYQGSIGGPRLPNAAYTAENVWLLLDSNALEFINSNRGVRLKGKGSAEVSKMYDWAAAAFNNSDEAIISHIQHYADAFHGDISGLSAIKPKYYDWNITDLLGGTLHSGQHTQLGGILVAGSGADGNQGLGAGAGGALVDTHALLGYAQNYVPTGSSNAFPPQAIDFLNQLRIRNELPSRTPVVSVLDCSMDDCDVPEEASEETPEQP